MKLFKYFWFYSASTKTSFLFLLVLITFSSEVQQKKKFASPKIVAQSKGKITKIEAYLKTQTNSVLTKYLVRTGNPRYLGT